MTDIEMPGRIARLRRDKVGRPVPWFVADVDGVPDFRLVKPGAVGLAVTAKSCWICGTLFARQEPRAFVIGPMCAVNLVSAEPPSHAECATYSARACPFLSTPNMTRRDRHLPADAADPPGHMIKRNPGVTAVWVCKYNRAFTVQRMPDGLLFNIGRPMFVEWWARGRRATRAEVMASIDSGMPELTDIAQHESGGLNQLNTQYRAALALIPHA